MIDFHQLKGLASCVCITMLVEGCATCAVKPDPGPGPGLPFTAAVEKGGFLNTMPDHKSAYSSDYVCLAADGAVKAYFPRMPLGVDTLHNGDPVTLSPKPGVVGQSPCPGEALNAPIQATFLGYQSMAHAPSQFVILARR